MQATRSWIAAATFVLLLFIGWLILGRAPASDSARLNVVLISIDTLRPDHLGAYGYTRPTSPDIDRLASEGVLFEQAISSSSWTLPSHASMFTSQTVPSHGTDEPDDKLPVGTPLLAEVLHDAGYATAGFYSVPFLGQEYGFDRGFDRYYNCTSHVRVRDDSLEVFKRQFGPGSPARDRATFLDVSSPRIHETVAHWLAEERRDPFFLFIHYYDAHWDFVPPAPYDTMFRSEEAYPVRARDQKLLADVGYPANPGVQSLAEMIALYDGEIRWTDMWIGKLLQLLRDQGLLDQTIVILTSDHGEEFGLHGAMYHGNNVFDEAIHVPLVIRAPGAVKGGRRVTQQVRTIDIYPTILDLVGIEAGPDAEGRSLVPLLAGSPQQLSVAHSSVAKIPWHRKNVPSEALRIDGGKLIRDTESGQLVFFDLEVDQRELNPIPVEEGRKASPLAERLAEAFEALMPAQVGSESEKVELEPALREQLRSLGYVE